MSSSRQLMKVVLIVNPYASAVSEARVRAVERELGRVAQVRTVLTERPGHGIELASAADGDALLVLSGDGGFNEVLNGARAGIPLGFLPGGGANVLSRALGLPRDPAAAARQVGEALEAGRTRTISVGRVNGRRFGFSAGLGFDAELVRRVDARGRRDDGKRPGNGAFITARPRPGGRAAAALRARARGRRARPGGIRARREHRPLHVRGARSRSTSRPEARFELGLDLVAPEAGDRGGPCRACSASCSTGTRARARARAASTRTTSTGSR